LLAKCNHQLLFSLLTKLASYTHCMHKNIIVTNMLHNSIPVATESNR
jgi:hypothetical protein